MERLSAVRSNGSEVIELGFALEFPDLLTDTSLVSSLIVLNSYIHNDLALWGPDFQIRSSSGAAAISAVPLPAALPLYATGVGLMGLLLVAEAKGCCSSPSVNPNHKNGRQAMTLVGEREPDNHNPPPHAPRYPRRLVWAPVAIQIISSNRLLRARFSAQSAR